MIVRAAEPDGLVRRRWSQYRPVLVVSVPVGDQGGNKSTRIAEYLAGAAVTSTSDWGLYIDWLIDRQTNLRAAVDSVGGLPGAR